MPGDDGPRVPPPAQRQTVGKILAEQEREKRRQQRRLGSGSSASGGRIVPAGILSAKLTGSFPDDTAFVTNLWRQTPGAISNGDPYIHVDIVLKLTNVVLDLAELRPIDAPLVGFCNWATGCHDTDFDPTVRTIGKFLTLWPIEIGFPEAVDATDNVSFDVPGVQGDGGDVQVGVSLSPASSPAFVSADVVVEIQSYGIYGSTP